MSKQISKSKNHSSNATASPLPAIRGDSRLDAPFKVSLYLRVSTDRQAKEGDSLDEQESELRKFCDYRGFHIHKTFIESGKSGGNTNRPEYQKLLADIEAKKINAVVVKKLDRLSRSLLDFEQLMTRLQANEVEFISLRENFDTTTAMGKAMLRVALVFAQLEREQTAERIKDVFAYRAEQGLYNGGTRPFGYDSLSSELVPHKKEKEMVQFIYASFLESKSSTIVARLCNAAGYRNRRGELWDKRQIHKILIHPVYTGKIRWNGLVSEGIHQPLITAETFEKAQDIFQERHYKREGKIILGLLKGFLLCSQCGGPMTPSYTQKKNKTKYYYYRCVKSLNPTTDRPCQNYPRMETTNAAVKEALLEAASEMVLSQISQEVAVRNGVIDLQIQGYALDIEEREAHLQSIQKKKETYLDSLISQSFSAQERQAINEKIAEFRLQEKHLKAEIAKVQFAKLETEEKKHTVGGFKEEMVFLKLHEETLRDVEFRKWLTKNVSQIRYAKDSLKIHFKIPDIWV